jgi:peptide chain release factor 1
MKILKARLLDHQRREQEEMIAKNRRKQVGRGERSEKVRTYNFPQRRFTDHRIGLSLYNLDRVLEGELDPVIDKLTIAHQESESEDE